MIKLKVSSFITVYNARIKHVDKTAENIVSTIKDIIQPIQYLGYDSKCQLVENAVESVNGIKYGTAKIYRRFIMNLLCAYTNLEVDESGFDDLCQTKMLDIILSTFESEYKICDGIMNMYLDDAWRWQKNGI